jgi:hypothetical protein
MGGKLEVAKPFANLEAVPVGIESWHHEPKARTQRFEEDKD